MIDKRILEFQTALCVDGDKEYIRVENIRKKIEKCNKQYNNEQATHIPVVPEIIKFSELKNSTLYRENYKIPIGISYNTVQYQMLDISKVGLLATFGREKKGKTNFVKHIFCGIHNNIFGTLTEAYIINDAERSLANLAEYGFVERYTTDISELEIIIDKLEKVLLDRQEKMTEDMNYSIEEQPLLLLVVENARIFDVLQNNKELASKITQMIKQYKKYKFAVILSAIENVAVPFSASEFMKFVKDNKKFVVFEELANIKFFDVTVKQIKDNSKPLDIGDAFVCFEGDIQRIKTIYVEE